MNNEEKYKLLMKEDKSTLVKTLIGLGNEISEIRKKLSEVTKGEEGGKNVS